MFAPFLDLLFPRRSLQGEEGLLITPRELEFLTSSVVTEEEVVLRQRGLNSIDRIVAASTYQDCPLLKKAVHTFKYRRISALAEQLGALLTHACGTLMLGDDAVLCPVPLHWSRQFQRGFNQAVLLANVLSRQCKIPVSNLLKRIQPTGHQAHRKRDARLTALQDAFRCVRGSVPRHIILIDDVSTTGATFDVCARELKNGGAVCVEGLVLAHDRARARCSAC